MNRRRTARTTGFLLAKSLALAGAALALLPLWQVIETRRDRRRYPPPGRLLPVAGTRLHVHETGPIGSPIGSPIASPIGNADTPTVVLESGLAATSLSWALVAPAMARLARVIAYDRAGLGWSEPARRKPSLRQLAAELAGVIEQLHISGPLVIVGHSFGALVVLAFAARWPERVRGIVLVDPVSIREWAACSQQQRSRLRVGARLSRRGALLARLGVVRLALALAARGGRLLPKLIGRVAAKPQGATLMNRLAGEITRLPPDVLLRVRAHWSRPEGFQEMAETLESLPACAQDAASLALPPDLPCTIISAGNATPSEVEEREAWLRTLKRGRHIRLERGAHWIQLEHPAVVVDEVRRLLDS